MLAKILRKLTTERDERCGICNNVKQEVRRRYEPMMSRADVDSAEYGYVLGMYFKRNRLYHNWMTNKFRQWWGFKGDTVYPVESNVAKYVNDSICEKLWENPRRLDLLEFLIMEAEKEGI